MAVTYIITPVGDLEGPAWREIEALPAGAGVIVLGLRLRDLAVRIDRGGRLERPTGEPYSTGDLAGILGYPVADVHYGLVVLARVSLVSQDGDTLVLTDPVLTRHVGRLAATAELPPPLALESEVPGESDHDRRRRLSRNRTTLWRYRRRWGCDPPQTYEVSRGTSQTVTTSVTRDGDATVTLSPQTVNITEQDQRHHTDTSTGTTDHHHISVMPDDDEALPDITPLLRDIPPAEHNKITPRIRKCLQAGHSLRDCQQAIDDARAGASKGSWVGLELIKALASQSPSPGATAQPGRRPRQRHNNCTLPPTAASITGRE